MKTYTNPILFEDYSDPDVIRVGNLFYMTASSFNYVPGLPLLVSADLVHWKLVNYAARSIPMPQFNTPRHARGVWAPAIRYHNGRFIIVVGLPDEGIFVTEAEDPLAAWSDLRCVWKGSGFIDPCPLWDDDGKAYIVHAYAKSRCGVKSRLGIMSADPDTLVCSAESGTKPGTGGDRFIFDGTETQPTIEGPKIYKRDGFYYILAPAGGVKEGWQTALRSRNIYGPYEEKIVMQQGSAETNGPHQGGLVSDTDGSEWFLHFQWRGVYGRIVHLQPVSWKDNWPCMGTAVKSGVLPGEPVMEYTLPSGKEALPESAHIPGSFGLQWQWTANYDSTFWTLAPGKKTEQPDLAGTVLNVLNTAKSRDICLWKCSNILTQRINAPSVSVKAVVDVSRLSESGRTGILLIGDQYGAVEVVKQGKKLTARYVESASESTNDGTSVTSDDVRLEKIAAQSESFVPDADILEFSLAFKNTGKFSAECSFSVGYTEHAHKKVWQPDVTPFVPDSGHWVGCRYGLYAAGSSAGSVQIIKTEISKSE